MCPLTSRVCIDLMAWRVHKIFPINSLSMIFLISLELSSVKRAFVKIPPLLTKRSTPPKVFSTQENACVTLASSAMSHSTAFSCPLIFNKPTRSASTLSFLKVYASIYVLTYFHLVSISPFSQSANNHS